MIYRKPSGGFLQNPPLGLEAITSILLHHQLPYRRTHAHEVNALGQIPYAEGYSAANVVKTFHNLAYRVDNKHLGFIANALQRHPVACWVGIESYNCFY